MGFGMKKNEQHYIITPNAETYSILVDFLGLTDAYAFLFLFVRKTSDVLYIPKLRRVIKQLTLPKDRQCRYMLAFGYLPSRKLFILSAAHGTKHLSLPSKRSAINLLKQAS